MRKLFLYVSEMNKFCTSNIVNIKTQCYKTILDNQIIYDQLRVNNIHININNICM